MAWLALTPSFPLYLTYECVYSLSTLISAKYLLCTLREIYYTLLKDNNQIGDAWLYERSSIGRKG
uniref:Uncharacterized protein n=1 Tax=Picea sitchensis TaxID=3332 RepID=A0A6B9XWV1_PICSI|nr:hypothetical protein Q903MT_gene6667 [Picea sitchensis]